jgi:protein arginine kinase activator
MSYDNFFGSFFDRVGDHEHEEMRCPNCGLEFRSFKKTGLLGCSVCYEYFAEYLVPSIKRVQGGLVHVGKFPKHAAIEMPNKRKLETLKRRLQEEIAKENFEEAAGIRDEINQLRREMKKEGETNA